MTTPTPNFGTETQRKAWQLVDQAHAAANRGDTAEFHRLMDELEPLEAARDAEIKAERDA